MSRYSVSPIKGSTRQNDPRDNIIKKLKEDLIVARGRQKQLTILQNYLIQVIQKTKLLTAQTAKCDQQGKLKLQLTTKSLNQLKKQLQLLKTQLRTISNQLGQIQQEQLQLKNILNTRYIQIQNHKREGISIHEDNDKLLAQQYRLSNQQHEMNNELKKIIQTLKEYQNKFVDINRKILDVKSYIDQINQENMILRQNLKKYQISNTDIGNDLQIKQNNIDFLQKSFAQKHKVIKDQVQNFIQLENHNEKITKESRHKLNLVKIQSEKSNELVNIINKLNKNINDKNHELHDILQSSNQLKRINQEIFNQNNKLKQQLKNCQLHLKNLVKNNILMNQQMEGYIKEDQKIINIIRRKRLIPIQNNMKIGRQSVKVSPIKFQGKNHLSYQ